MRKKMAALVITGALICATVTGCGEETTEETTELTTTEVVIEVATAEDATPDEPEQLKAIGEATENGYEVNLINSTGQDIVELEIYDTTSEEYGDNLLDEDDAFLAGEERILYCASLSEDTEEGESTEEKLITVGYDIKIVLADESEYVLHSFPFGEIEAGELFIEDEVAYVEYDGYSTKEAELSIKEAEEYTNVDTQSNTSVTSTPATTQAPTSTQAPAVTEAPVVTETTEAVVAPSEPDTSGNDVGDQGSENCIGDEGLTY